MQAFKLFFKVVKRGALGMILLYVGIFAALACLWGSQSVSPATSAFETEKAKVAVINRDNSELSEHLADYVSGNSTPVTVKDDELSMKDSLFYEEAHYILIIPENFGENFGTDNAIQLSFMQKPDSTYAVMVSQMINNYLNLAQMYQSTGSIDFEALDKSVSAETSVTLTNHQETQNNRTGMCYFVNYLAYPLLGILIFCVGYTMLTFNQNDVRRRNLIAPVNAGKTNMQFFLFNGIMALAVFVVFMVITYFMNPEQFFTTKGLLWSLNALVLTISSLALSFMVSTLVGKAGIGALSTVIPLGFSFLGGVFVPQSLLSGVVRSIAIINPVYWYVEANESINSISTFTAETMQVYALDMVKLLAYGAAFVAIALVASKFKQTQRN